MTRLLSAMFVALTFAAPAAAAPSGPSVTAYSRHTSPTLRPFGSDEAFMDYLAEARAAAHARGTWWYGWDSVKPAAAANGWGLEVLPGTHGGYDYEEADLPSGGKLYYSTVDLTRIHQDQDVDIVWPGLRPRGRVRAGSTTGPPDGLYRQALRNPLWTPAEIYRPVRDTLEPTIHSFTICTRRAVLGAHPSGCRTTAFVAPRGDILLVTESHAYVWTAPEYGDLEALKADPACPLRAAGLEAEGLPSLVYRLPLAGGPLEVLGTRGAPAWGSGFNVEAGRLRALVAWPDLECKGEVREGPRHDIAAPPARLTLLDAPLDLFGRRLAETPHEFEARLPPAASGAVVVRFAGDWLLYGDLTYEFDVPYRDQPPRTGYMFAVPIAQPGNARRIELPHNLVAIVQAGRRALLTGYRDSTGLELSVLDLGAEPRFVSAMRLPGLRQKAGLSGYIGTVQRPDGSVVIALPTVRLDEPPEERESAILAGKVVNLLIDPSGRIGPYDRPPR